MKTITKYYSELLDKQFDSVEELEAEEAAYTEKHEKELALREERKVAAKNVEDLFKEAHDKLKEANEALVEFNKKFGPYHKSIVSPNNKKSLLDFYFDSWMF